MNMCMDSRQRLCGLVSGKVGLFLNINFGVFTILMCKRLLMISDMKLFVYWSLVKFTYVEMLSLGFVPQLFIFGSSPYLMFELSCFSGDVVLKDLKLKAEALNSLKLPVAVKSGFVGTITLKVAIFLLLLVDAAT